MKFRKKVLFINNTSSINARMLGKTECSQFKGL